VVLDKKGTANLNNNVGTGDISLSSIVTFFEDLIPCDMEIDEDTGDDDELLDGNDIEVGLPPGDVLSAQKGDSERGNTAGPSYKTLVMSDEFMIEVDDEEEAATFQPIAKALEESGKQAGLMSPFPSDFLTTRKGRGRLVVPKDMCARKTTRAETDASMSGVCATAPRKGGISMPCGATSVPGGGGDLSASD